MKMGRRNFIKFQRAPPVAGVFTAAARFARVPARPIPRFLHGHWGRH